MRPVKIIVTSFTLGNARIKSFPDDQNSRILYRVPLYRVYVEGRDVANNLVQEDFEAVRFGVHKPYSSHARMVGLAEAQRHILTWDWITTMQEDAWRVYDGFFIHRGPRDPMFGFGSIGCVEICGIDEWDRFNNTILNLTGLTSFTEISNKQLLIAEYESATRPPLTLV